MKVFGQLEKAQLENTTADAASMPKGFITYRTDLNIAKISNGTSMLALIDESSTQTLSGKTYASPIFTGPFTMGQTTTPANPSSGNNKFYFKADGKLYTLDAAGNEAAVGSGAGGGVTNLITNGNADDTAASIFVPYADAAGTRPVDGTGGAPTVTTTVSTVSPLNGTKSYLLTKPASNTQGQGWAIPFTVDLAYRAKSLKISADFIINSGTFVPGTAIPQTDGDLIWYIYDVTNSQLIEPSNIRMLSSSTTISDKFQATFQTSVTGASYRLIAHCASTSALAYEIKLDNVTVTPQVSVLGTAVSDWAPYTPSLTGFGTATNIDAKMRRVGDTLEVVGSFTVGTSTGVTAQIGLPSGLSIDTTKSLGTSSRGMLGFATRAANGVTNGLAATTTGPFVIVEETQTATSAVFLATQTNSTANGYLLATGSGAVASGDTLTFKFSVPILGWSSSVQLSESADTRVTAAVITASDSFSPAIDAKFTNLVASRDTHGAVTSTRYNFPSEGFYFITQAVQFGSTSSAFRAVEYHFNGVLTRIEGNNGTTSTATDMSASYGVYAKLGDYIEFGAFQNTGALETVSLKAAIQKVQGPQAIAASESYAMRYTSSSGQSIPSGGTIISFANKTYDTHGSWNGTTFTALQARTFSVKAIICMNAPNSGASTNVMNIYKNGVLRAQKVYVGTYISGAPYYFDVADDVEMLVGDTLYIHFNNGFGPTTALVAAVENNYISIK